jgi:hypothetical protein
MGRMLRSLLLASTLSLWLGSAGAFCVSEVAYEYVMRGEEPAPEQTLPCCSAAGQVTASAPKDLPIGGEAACASSDFAAGIDYVPRCVARDCRSPLRWRAYCERSSRLLR